MNEGCPCKNCDARYIHCHSECVAYGIWKYEMAEAREQIKERKEKEIMLDKVKRSGIDRIKKHHKRI